MDSFLTSRFHTLESVSDIRSSYPSQNLPKRNLQSKTESARGPRKVNTYHTNVSSNQSRKCSLCPEFHPLRLCPTFLHMSVDERFDTVKNQKRCTNCLATSHDFKRCKSHYVCSICKLKHHSLLHRSPSLVTNQATQNNPIGAHSTPFVHPISGNLPRTISQEQPTTSAESARVRQSYSTHLQSTPSNVTLLGTASVKINIGDLTHTVRALIDPASEASFISKRIQKKLSLPSKTSQTQIVGLSGVITATSTQTCSIQITSELEPLFNTNVTVFVVSELTGQLPYYPYSSTDQIEFSGLSMADTNHSRCHVDLLLGGDVYPRIIRSGVRWNRNQTLVAQQSVFGWIITGQATKSSSNYAVTSLLT